MQTGRYFTYIMASGSGTLYIGITNDIYLRVAQHKIGINKKSFTSTYNCIKLVLFEEFFDPGEAILREKQLKNWNRAKKEWLISLRNPGWRDLSMEWKMPVATPYTDEVFPHEGAASSNRQLDERGPSTRRERTVASTKYEARLRSG